jgi:uncharacterized repeat protein (TIGR01451 family)
MKTFFLVLVLAMICIMPSQSQMSSVVSDVEMSAVDEHKLNGPHIFEREMNSSICVNQTFQSRDDFINYYIFVKNSGETTLTDVTVEDLLPEGALYRKSRYIYSDDDNLTLIDLVSKRDNTTKILRWYLCDLNTGDEKKIMLQVDRGDRNNRADDSKNVVRVWATALNQSEKEQLETAVKKISAISTNCQEPDVSGNNVATYEILVENVGKTRLMDVVLNDTLPANKRYLGSKCFNESGGQVPLLNPTVINNSDGTTKRLSWFLGDFDTGTQKTVKFSVSCDDNSCSIQDNEVEASGWTSIISKVPIRVNSTVVICKENVSEPGPSVDVGEITTTLEVNESAVIPDEIVD